MPLIFPVDFYMILRPAERGITHSITLKSNIARSLLLGSQEAEAIDPLPNRPVGTSQPTPSSPFSFQGRLL